MESCLVITPDDLRFLGAKVSVKCRQRGLEILRASPFSRKETKRLCALPAVQRVLQPAPSSILVAGGWRISLLVGRDALIICAAAAEEVAAAYQVSGAIVCLDGDNLLELFFPDLIPLL